LHRIDRIIRNNTESLLTMQTQRKDAQREAENEVKLLARAAFAKGHDYDPDPDFPPERGFVFSHAQVVRMVDRDDRLDQARALPPTLPADHGAATGGWVYFARQIHPSGRPGSTFELRPAA